MTFQEFAKEKNLCIICAGSGNDPAYDTGSPDDIIIPCWLCKGKGDQPLTIIAIWRAIKSKEKLWSRPNN